MQQNDEYASWLESRRLVIAQLSTMEESIRDPSAKIDKFSEAAREKAFDVAKDAQLGISDLEPARRHAGTEGKTLGRHDRIAWRCGRDRHRAGDDVCIGTMMPYRSGFGSVDPNSPARASDGDFNARIAPSRRWRLMRLRRITAPP